jgi:hypothetical protein
LNIEHEPRRFASRLPLLKLDDKRLSFDCPFVIVSDFRFSAQWICVSGAGCTARFGGGILCVSSALASARRGRCARARTSLRMKPHDHHRSFVQSSKARKAQRVSSDASSSARRGIGSFQGNSPMM